MDTSAWVAVIGAIIALLSGGFTAISARATVKQAAEAQHQTELQQKIFEDSTQPYVWVDIAPDTTQGALLKLTLCNEGPTVATNIHVKFDPPLAEVFGFGKIDRIQESIEAGISYLAPGRRTQWVLDVGHKFFARTPTPSVTASITCDGPHGPCPLNTYILNLNYVRYSHDNPDGSLHRVAERIKDLTNVIKKANDRRDARN